MSRYRPTDRLGWVFEIALILKGLDGVLETIGGVLLLAVPAETLNNWLVSATQHELSEDPNDFVFSHLLSFGATHPRDVPDLRRSVLARTRSGESGSRRRRAHETSCGPTPG